MIFKEIEKQSKKVTDKMEKSCETCNDYIVCLTYEKLQKEPCENWTPDFMEWQERMEEIRADYGAG